MQRNSLAPVAARRNLICQKEKDSLQWIRNTKLQLLMPVWVSTGQHDTDRTMAEQTYRTARGKGAKQATIENRTKGKASQWIHWCHGWCLLLSLPLSPREVPFFVERETSDISSQQQRPHSPPTGHSLITPNHTNQSSNGSNQWIHPVYPVQ